MECSAGRASHVVGTLRCAGAAADDTQVISVIKQRGVVATVVGAAACGSVAFASITMLVAGPSSDAENGWWHDPDGWLLFLIPPGTLIGMVVGAYVALLIRGYGQRGRTVAFVFLFGTFGMFLGGTGGAFRLLADWAAPPLPYWVLVAGDIVVSLVVAAVGARVVATRNDTPTPSGQEVSHSRNPDR